LPIPVQSAPVITVNKKALLQAIVEKLSADLALYFKAATVARFEATHEQSKAENKYDTRGLEASYLARGQSRQAAEIEFSIHTIGAMEPRDFSSGLPIDVGAFVEVSHRKETSCYFICSRAGGTEVVFEGAEVMVITPQSPLGSQLVGRKEGDSVKIEIGGRATIQKLVRVL
jgi:transcription elongation GreA/GreB family factor